MTGWVRVTERLPVEDGHYLVWGFTGGMDYASWSGDTREWQICTPHDFIEIAADRGEITHWMLLPDPPNKIGS